MIGREAVDIGCSVRRGLLDAVSVTPRGTARALAVPRDTARLCLRAAAIAARICTASDSASMAFPRSITKTAVLIGSFMPILFIIWTAAMVVVAATCSGDMSLRKGPYSQRSLSFAFFFAFDSASSTSFISFFSFCVNISCHCQSKAPSLPCWRLLTMPIFVIFSCSRRHLSIADSMASVSSRDCRASAYWRSTSSGVP